jgi:hypothetical protein
VKSHRSLFERGNNRFENVVQSVADLARHQAKSETPKFIPINALVPRANRLGVAWARVHTSAFESKAQGARMLAGWRRQLRKVVISPVLLQLRL